MILGALSDEERHSQMATAIGLFPDMAKKAKFNDRKVSIVCYGPSLIETWKDIKGPVVTVSGAHDFMVERGVIPDWHIECDPREHKARMLKLPQKTTRYRMASCCHPSVWEALKGCNVKLWHLINGESMVTPHWLRDNHPDGLDAMIGGGSTVGMRALEVCSALGFRRFDIYGMDCSFTDRHHAGTHTGKHQTEILVRVGGEVFKTSPQMYQAAQEMEKFLSTYDVETHFHGQGLMQATARALSTRKAA